MDYLTTITKKGQITIPKEIRDALQLEEMKKILIKFRRGRRRIEIKPSPDILDLAGTFKPKKKVNVLKAREAMEKRYERV